MKLPEKPPEWEKILKKEGDKVFSSIRERSLLKKAVEYNKRYLFWDELKYRVKDNIQQKHLWTFMKLMRSEKYEMLYSKLSLKYANLSEINMHLHRIDKFLAGNIGFEGKNLDLESKYIISSLMEEAIASSIIEGAATTRKAAKRMLKQRLKPKDKNEQMVLNGYETMQMIIKRKNEKLTPDLLLEVQANITKNTIDKKDVGKFRDNNEIIVGHDTNPDIIYHIPPDYKKIKDMIKDLCEYANNEEGEFVHPVIKGIVLHFLLGYIHPFNDGNGRTARSVFYWYVLSRGYWLFEYMALSRRILLSKKDYGLAYLYTELDEFDATYFIKYNLEAINDALDDLLRYIQSKRKEKEDTRRIVEKVKRISYRQANILEDMINNPEKIYTIQEISQVYHVVYQTARTDLLMLHKMGFADMRKVGKKYVFKYSGKMVE